MKQIIKIVQEIGNGGHIYLPKEMVGQKVMISLKEKTIEDIEEEIIYILKPYLKHIKGIYLYGSYARKEQTAESDIDILVITDSEIKIKKRINEYEIISISLGQIEKTIKHTAVLILPILKEAKTILNKELIEKYRKERLTKKNTKWYIETTESSLKLAKDWISEEDIKSMPSIVYPLIMRLKGLYFIESLINDNAYSNKDIIYHMVKKGISQDKAKQLYRMYSEHRDNKVISENSLDYEDVSRLYSVVYGYFQKVKLLWARLK